MFSISFIHENIATQFSVTMALKYLTKVPHIYVSNIPLINCILFLSLFKTFYYQSVSCC